MVLYVKAQKNLGGFVIMLQQILTSLSGQIAHGLGDAKAISTDVSNKIGRGALLTNLIADNPTLQKRPQEEQLAAAKKGMVYMQRVIASGPQGLLDPATQLGMQAALDEILSNTEEYQRQLKELLTDLYYHQQLQESIFLNFAQVGIKELIFLMLCLSPASPIAIGISAGLSGARALPMLLVQWDKYQLRKLEGKIDKELEGECALYKEITCRILQQYSIMFSARPDLSAELIEHAQGLLRDTDARIQGAVAIEKVEEIFNQAFFQVNNIQNPRNVEGIRVGDLRVQRHLVDVERKKLTPEDAKRAQDIRDIEAEIEETGQLLTYCKQPKTSSIGAGLFDKIYSFDKIYEQKKKTITAKYKKRIEKSNQGITESIDELLARGTEPSDTNVSYLKDCGERQAQALCDERDQALRHLESQCHPGEKELLAKLTELQDKLDKLKTPPAEQVIQLDAEIAKLQTSLQELQKELLTHSKSKLLPDNAATKKCKETIKTAEDRLTKMQTQRKKMAEIVLNLSMRERSVQVDIELAKVKERHDMLSPKDRRDTIFSYASSETFFASRAISPTSTTSASLSSSTSSTTPLLSSPPLMRSDATRDLTF